MAIKVTNIKLGIKLKVLSPRFLPEELNAEKGHILQVHFISDAFGLDTKFAKQNEAIVLKVDNLNTHVFESAVISCSKWMRGVRLYKD